MIKARIVLVLTTAVFVALVVVFLRKGAVGDTSRVESSPVSPVPPSRDIVLLTYGQYVAPGVLIRGELELGIRVTIKTYTDPVGLRAALADRQKPVDVIIMNSEWVSGFLSSGALSPIGDLGDGVAWRKNFVGGVTGRTDDPNDRFTRPYFAYRLGLLMRQGQAYEAQRITTVDELLRHAPLAVGTDPMLTMAGIRALGGVQRPALSGGWTEEQSRIVRSLLHGLGALPAHEAAALVLQGRAQAALIGGGDAARTLRDQTDLRFVPIGTEDVIRVDVLAVSAHSAGKVAAESLVNWLCTSGSGAENARYTGYPSPMTHAECVSVHDPAIRTMVEWHRSAASNFVHDYIAPDITLLRTWGSLRE